MRSRTAAIMTTVLGLSFLLTGFHLSPARAERGGIHPGAHRVLHFEQWAQLPLQGVRSIETDIRYTDGIFYMAHDADEEDRERTLHRLLWDVIAEMADYYSGEETTFIYLDIKKSGGLRGAARLYAEISRLHDSCPQLNIRWVLTGEGPSAYVLYFREHPEALDLIGLDLLVKKQDANRTYRAKDYTIKRDYLDLNVQDRDPVAFVFGKTPKTSVLEFYLSPGNHHLLADWLKRPPGGQRDVYPIRLWTPNKKKTVHEIIDLVKEARENGGLHRDRDLYLCNDHDAARQFLWLAEDAEVTGQMGFNTYRDTGRDAAVSTIAFNGRQYIVEVHRTHTGGKGLWYSTHRRNLETSVFTVLKAATRYDTGMDPDVALVEHDGSVYVCEVHWDTKRGKSSVWYSWFKLDLHSGTLDRTAHGKLCKGRLPTVSLVSVVDRVYAAVMNEAGGNHRLSLSLLGADPENPSSMKRLHNAGVGYRGVQPDIAVMAVDEGLLVTEVHTSQNHNTLWSTQFTFDLNGRLRSGTVPRQYDRGNNPSISITMPGDARATNEAIVLETHSGGNDRLWYTLTRLGHWQKSEGLVSEQFRIPATFVHGHYDTGKNPSVSLDSEVDHGVVMVEIHETGERKLWMDSWHIAPWTDRLP